MPRKNAAVSRPRSPGPVKYSDFARNVTRLGTITGITKWSENDRWLPAMIAGPCKGTCSSPSTRGRKISRSNGPRITYLST
ncbi:hypothetical protein SRIMM317S_05875 [Streptomyces rimosus subsp. rimosus]